MVQAEGRTFEFDGVDAIEPQVLEVFPYEYPHRTAEVVIASDEWSCVCPYSGLPDYGRITIRYTPGTSCLELKALKYYLTSYRSVGIYQEHAVNRVLEDLVAACAPRTMAVELDYHLRGGIHTVVTASYPAPAPGNAV